MESQTESRQAMENRILGRAGRFRGNLDRSLILRNEYEVSLFWCKLKNSEDRVRNGAPQFVVKAFRRSAWDGFQRLLKSQEVTWWKLGGYTEMKLLHDPSLVRDINDLIIKA